MGNVIIAHQNAADDPGVTITSSTEVAGFEKENVQAVQLSERFRTAVVNPAWLRFENLPKIGSRFIGLFGTNLTGHRSHLHYSGDLSNAVWVQNKMGGVAADFTDEDPFGGNRSWLLTEDNTAGEHYIEQTRTLKLAADKNTAAYTVYVRQQPSAVRNLWIRYSLGGAVDEAVINTSSGAVLSGSATVETILSPNENKTWYKVTVTGADPAPASTALVVRIGLADGSSTSYTGSSFTLTVHGAQFESARNYDLMPATTFGPPADNTTDTAPNVEFGYVSDFDGSAVLTPFTNDLRGRQVDFWRLWPGGGSLDDDMLLNLHDDDNADSYVEVGRVFIGPVWQSSVQTLTALTIDHVRGRRIFRVAMNYATEAEAYAQALELGRLLDIGRADQQAEMLGGQIIRPRQGAVVLIVNPDEPSYLPQQTLYGFVNELRVRYAGTKANGDRLYSVRLEVEEIIP